MNEPRSISRPARDRLARPRTAPAPAPFAFAVLTLGAGERIVDVAVARDWDLGAAAAAWSGRALADLFDAAGARAILRALREEVAEPVDVLCRTAHADVPVSVVVGTSEDEVLLHLADRRGMAEAQAQLSRALTALEMDRREERGLDGRHRALLSGISEAIVLVDTASGRMIEMTGAAGRMLGRQAEGLAGAAFTQCFEGRRRSEFIDTLVAAALSGSGLPTRADLRHGRGRIEIWASMAQAADETLLVCRMRQAGGDEVDALPRAMARLVTGTRDGIACLDAEGSVVHANQAFVAMTGAATASQIVGRHLARHLLRGDIDMRALSERGRPSVLSTRIVGLDGRRLPVEIAATDLPEGGLGLILRDIALANVMRDGGADPCAEVGAQTANMVGTASLRDIVAATTDAVERSCIDAALGLTGGNRAAAADMLGLSRQSLYVKLRKFDLLDRDEV